MERTLKLNKIFNSLSKEKAINIMYNSNNISDFLEKIGERKGGSGYKRFYDYCKKYEINYNNYFKYEIKKFKKLTLEQILVKNSSYSNTNSLKQKLIKLQILENKCNICNNNGEWNNKKLSLHLDHINGINNDNRIENLRILCPNCHSQTDTYCGKNINKKNVENSKKYYCIECNNEIWNSSTRCRDCYLIKRRKVKERPDKNTLLELLKTNSYVSLGKKFNVSDNTIRKWLK
jgi:hypothetical protein